jgi:CheY-like chemotaxis protein
MVMECMLQELKHDFRLAENGQVALDILPSFQPDVILMDVSMPVMSGPEATAAIRKREPAGGGHVPIIGVTAHALSGDREKCLAAGMDDYLSKPVTKAALAEKIDHWAATASRKSGAA